MELLHSVILGFVQGLTEFLPISSSGHLVIFSALYKFFTNQELGVATSEEIFLDIILHLGTLIAVLFYFRKDVLDIAKGLFNSLKTKDFTSKESKTGMFLILGTFFTLLMAYPLKDFCETLVSSPMIVCCMLLATGTIILVSEIVGTKLEKKDIITWKHAIMIGIAQGLAIFPGISRSGMTISTGLFCGLTRVESARFSFLLSILIIAGASIFYPILEIDFSILKGFNWISILGGFVVAIISGYLCIKYFMQFLNKYSMKVFAYYCFLVGILGFIFFRFII